MKTLENFRKMLEERGYSAEAIEQMWKWYDHSEKKGVASF
jgi:hypothetical protein